MKKKPSIEIIGTESLGVRGMCCLVTVGKRRILIDPGIALGYRRHGLLPHPGQINTGIKIRQRILEAMRGATDIVFSHFHGDHVPLLRANPYQLSFGQMADYLPDAHIWTKSKEGLSAKMQHRALDLEELFGAKLKVAEECQDGPLTFSGPVPHGLPGERFGTVMMTRIDMGTKVFVHASDIQLLNNETVSKILQWQPTIVFVDGPPLYLGSLTGLQRKKAWENGLRLARSVEMLIIDHHLLRSESGLLWLSNMSRIAGGKIYCAADFMHKPRLPLEAQRPELYRKIPVNENWHRNYEAGQININHPVLKQPPAKRKNHS